ncbi:UNVERIFIED_CONTAM: FxsA family protein, partial [Bacteroidetes bacterium 56_B9]
MAMRDVQRAMAEFRDPTAPLAHGALVMMAGMLLILPGFLTDALGLLLLVAPVRTLVLRGMGRQVRVRRAGFGLP